MLVVNSAGSSVTCSLPCGRSEPAPDVLDAPAESSLLDPHPATATAMATHSAAALISFGRFII